MTHPNKLILLTGILAIAIATPSFADSISFSCPAVKECNGATYALTIKATDVLDSGKTAYELSYGIDTAGYTGKSTDFIHSISFKDIIADFEDMQLVDAPGGAENWTLFSSGLNANGCKGKGEIGTCVEAGSGLNGGYGMPVLQAGVSNQYFWEFTFVSKHEPNATGHIKYQYVRNTRNKQGFVKAGSLGSFDIALEDVTPSPSADSQKATSVPEPSIMAMLLVGLIALGARARRTASILTM
jgi:hypothetical protein